MKNKSPILTVVICGVLATLLWRIASVWMLGTVPAQAAVDPPPISPNDERESEAGGAANPQAVLSARAEPAAVNKAPNVSADQLLQQAVLAIDRYQTVTAKIRHKVELFDSRLIGSGMYWQAGQGGDKRLRMELKIPVAGKVSTLQQVCNDDYLWIHESFGEQSQLTQIDVRRVRRAISQSPQALRGDSSLRWMALGGLPMLLASLQEGFQFSFVTQQASGTGAVRDHRPTWVLLGQWKRNKLARLLGEPPGTDGSPSVSRLPAHVPDHVLLHLSKQDLFPYSVDFRKRDKNAEDEAGALARAKSLVLMELFDVQLNDPVDPSWFLYDPGNLKRINGTERFLQRLGLTAEGKAIE